MTYSKIKYRKRISKYYLTSHYVLVRNTPGLLIISPGGIPHATLEVIRGYIIRIIDVFSSFCAILSITVYTMSVCVS